MTRGAICHPGRMMHISATQRYVQVAMTTESVGWESLNKATAQKFPTAQSPPGMALAISYPPEVLLMKDAVGRMKGQREGIAGMVTW